METKTHVNLWDIIKPYYHDHDAKVIGCTVTIEAGGESSIHCKYSENTGGVTELDIVTKTALFKELTKALDIDAKHVSTLTVELEEGYLPKVTVNYLYT